MLARSRRLGRHNHPLDENDATLMIHCDERTASSISALKPSAFYHPRSIDIYVNDLPADPSRGALRPLRNNVGAGVSLKEGANIVSSMFLKAVRGQQTLRS